MSQKVQTLYSQAHASTRRSGCGERPEGVFGRHIIPASGEVTIPLSNVQRRIWLEEQFAQGVPLFREILLLQLPEQIDVDALNRAFSAVIERHEVLRVTFKVANAQPIQTLTECKWAGLRVTESTAQTEQGRTSEIQRIATQEFQQSFDLAQSPLIRAQLLCFRPGASVLVLTLHGLVADEHSLHILRRELFAFYRSFSEDKPCSLPELPIQFAD